MSTYAGRMQKHIHPFPSIPALSIELPVHSNSNLPSLVSSDRMGGGSPSKYKSKASISRYGSNRKTNERLWLKILGGLIVLGTIYLLLRRTPSQKVAASLIIDRFSTLPFTPPLLNEQDVASQPREGQIVIIVNDLIELKAITKLACRFNRTRFLSVIIFDYPDTSHTSTCHLNLINITSSPSTNLKHVGTLAQHLRTIGAFEMGIYINSAASAHRNHLTILQEAGGKYQDQSRRDNPTEEPGMIVIGLTLLEVVHAEWIGLLPVPALRQWWIPRIDLIVITNDRPASLSRLLTSLTTADYFSDTPSLSISLEQTATDRTHALLDNFAWSYGHYTLRHRVVRGGLLPAIIESWYPTSNHTFAVILEDDIELSPHFYGYLKYALLTYRYSSPSSSSPASSSSKKLFGISLYQQQTNELHLTGRQLFNAHALFPPSYSPTSPYLSPIPCSWGALYTPEIWREFHAYLALRLSESAIAIETDVVPEVRSNNWYRSWKKYWIELSYLRGYVMLYPNYGFDPLLEDEAGVSLSTNHLEVGVHNKNRKRAGATTVVLSAEEERKEWEKTARTKRLFNVPLLDPMRSGRRSILSGLPQGRLPNWSELPVVDLWGEMSSEKELRAEGRQAVKGLGSCRPAAPSTKFFRSSRDGAHVEMRAEEDEERYDAKELLCPKIKVERVKSIHAFDLPRVARVLHNDDARVEGDEGEGEATVGDEVDWEEEEPERVTLR